MCGRFTLRKDTDALAAHFAAEAPPAGARPAAPRYNIAPTQAIPVVRAGAATGRPELVWMRWGLDPPWASTPGGAPPLINARAETLAAKPAFRDSFRARRCLVPADGFYEWQKLDRAKQPWFIHFPDDRLFAFAGIWRPGRGADGAPRDCCAIITTAPVPALARLHDRMPAIQRPGDYAAWLDPSLSDPAALSPLLAPGRTLAAAAELHLYPVRATVNYAENDSPACIAAA
ncbi:MAG: SOS response-associated peptidase [Terriglobales bacterium]